ncbi:hypothetical protein ACLOJK_041740 [Asimina triloba]
MVKLRIAGKRIALVEEESISSHGVAAGPSSVDGKSSLAASNARPVCPPPVHCPDHFAEARQQHPSASAISVQRLAPPESSQQRVSSHIRQSAVGLVPHPSISSGPRPTSSVDDISSGPHISQSSTFGVFWRFRAHLLSLYIGGTPFEGCAYFGFVGWVVELRLQTQNSSRLEPITQSSNADACIASATVEMVS